MSMPTTDYNQQLLCYLHNWRHLLEQWAAMAAGSPFLTAPPSLPLAPPGFPGMPPAFPGTPGGQFMAPFLPLIPFMPFTPLTPPLPPNTSGSPTPPAPADYAQQLFGYLQAWRQYLEQATGSSSTAPQTGPAAPPPPFPGSGPAVRPPDVPVPPDDPTGSKGVPQSDDHGGSGRIPPRVVARAPSNVLQSQLTATNSDPAFSPFDGPAEPFSMSDPAALQARPETARPISAAPAHPEAGSPYLSIMSRVGPVVPAQPAPKSLLSNVSAKIHDAGDSSF